MTSNKPESLEIPGSGRRILLHIVAEIDQNPEDGRIKLPIKAQFLLDGQTTKALTFVDETVRIPHFDDCLFTAKDDQIGQIAMGEA